MLNPILIISAILPGILICVLIYFLDKQEKEGLLPLVLTFGLGMLSALPAIGLQMLAAKTGIDESQNLGLLLIYVFLIVALSEELVKLAMVLIYPFPKPFFNEPLDGIVYTLMVGMGFAVVENVMYAYNYGLETVLVRAFTAVPAHAIFAIFMGYFVGLAKFKPLRKKKIIIFGLVLAVAIHGIYDFFILQRYYDWLMLFGLLTLAISGYLSWLLIKDHRDNSPFRIMDVADTMEDKELPSV